jgi:hypothetical protein
VEKERASVKWSGVDNDRRDIEERKRKGSGGNVMSGGLGYVVMSSADRDR